MKIARIFSCIAILLAAASIGVARAGLVEVRGERFYVGDEPYFFVGANYWYGSLLGREKDEHRGAARLRSELDMLKRLGITNLRVLAGAEGEGMLNGITRVGPPLQPEKGKFDEDALKGLDLLLAEMRKRDMRAVIYLSNNWEWSGGFQQYLLWEKRIDPTLTTRKPSWDELRDTVKEFYSCSRCIAAYQTQAAKVISRRNSVNKIEYAKDPTIMAWEIANEPRPMRPAANDAYVAFLKGTSALIRTLDPKHLITIGHEGHIGTESVELFKKVHSDKNIDYLTIHIWPKNWGWLADGELEKALANAESETQKYVDANLAVAHDLKKPLVIEEFGFPRDGRSFDRSSTTKLRDRYFELILSQLGSSRQGTVAGVNFWAFAGRGRAAHSNYIWKPGDDHTGDPPMEEQGLNSVFDTDRSTLSVLRKAARRAKSL
ncbi:MAG TPA: cellulase family glycosylhydrolase [Pyrinomonadaceae bacterium]|nr:cellulase family glycosylhydrolase [Pyrinomonadaceae bacterium]